MCADVYIAGPVIDSPRDLKTELYFALAAEVEAMGASFALPERDGEIDALAPEDFTRRIAGRIRDAQVVVTVLSAGDQSVPIEAAMASQFGKPQLVLLDGVEPPRILAGLPFVSLARVEDRGKALEAVREILGGLGRA